MAEYDVDIRSINKTALNMLKSSASIDKSILRSFKTNLKSSPFALCSITGSVTGNESLDGQSIESSKIYSKLAVNAHKQVATVKPQNVKPRATKQDAINRRCWDVFNAYALNPTGDIPFDACEYGIPIEQLSVALHALYCEGLLKDIENIGDLLTSRSQSMLSWVDFRDLVFDAMRQERAAVSHVKENRATHGTDSFGNLIQKQRLDSSVVLDGVPDSSVVSSVDQSPSIVRLKGKLVPAPCLKDALVDVSTKEGRRRAGRNRIRGGRVSSAVSKSKSFALLPLSQSPRLCTSTTRRN